MANGFVSSYQHDSSRWTHGDDHQRNADYRVLGLSLDYCCSIVLKQFRCVTKRRSPSRCWVGLELVGWGHESSTLTGTAKEKSFHRRCPLHEGMPSPRDRNFFLKFPGLSEWAATCRLQVSALYEVDGKQGTQAGVWMVMCCCCRAIWMCCLWAYLCSSLPGLSPQRVHTVGVRGTGNDGGINLIWHRTLGYHLKGWTLVF